MTLTLNIVGCGRTGRTLARLWTGHRTLQVQDVLNRSRDSAAAAVAFIGAGRAAERMDQMRPAKLWLIGTSDDQIAAASLRLAQSGLLREGDVVFHLSGAQACDECRPARERGARLASVHPVKSFAEPEAAARSFAGTYCAIEGDAPAVALLVPVFGAIGGKTFPVDSEFKAIYHAASVFACNYLVALLEVAVRCYSKGGLSRSTALEIMQPLVRETVDNLFRLGTVGALTGPIARGDDATVARQMAALQEWQPAKADLYRLLGAVALELARAQGTARPDALERLHALLPDPPS